MEGSRVHGTSAKFLGECNVWIRKILGLRESKGLEYLKGKIRVIFFIQDHPTPLGTTQICIKLNEECSLFNKNIYNRNLLDWKAFPEAVKYK